MADQYKVEVTYQESLECTREKLRETMRRIDDCGMEKFCTLDSSEKHIAMRGDRWYLPAATREGDDNTK